MTEKALIVVADSHLGVRAGDVELMVRFVNSLDPDRRELLFLGDLFHIWAAPAKYHTAKVKTLLRALENFRKKNGKARLMAGNRDIFFPEIKSGEDRRGLPFDSISQDAAFLFSEGQKIMAVHGDTVNSRDKRYLLWRKLVRNPLFKFFFSLQSAGRVKKVMFKLEENLKSSNMEFKKDFPRPEWEEFIKEARRRFSPQMLLAGHFHPAEPIISERGEFSAIVVPDWHENQIYMEIEPGLKYRFRKYPS